MNDYKAVHYSGKEWVLWHTPTRNCVVWGTKAQITKRAKELNQEQANEPQTIQTPSGRQTLA